MIRQLPVAVASILFLLLLPSVSAAQAQYPVELLHSGSDQVGTLYAFELREAIRGSNGMRLVTEGLDPRIKVSVVTIDAGSPRDRGISSAIAVTILYDSLEVPLGGAHLTTVVQVCGRDRAEFCARSLLSTIDSEVSRLQQRSQTLWKTLFRSR
jgi:hypothetical protein